MIPRQDNDFINLRRLYIDFDLLDLKLAYSVETRTSNNEVVLNRYNHQKSYPPALPGSTIFQVIFALKLVSNFILGSRFSLYVLSGFFQSEVPNFILWNEI